MTDDLKDRLRIRLWSEETMQRWDNVRTLLLSGMTGSHPRDVIEAELDGWDEDRRDALTRIEQLEQTLAAAEAEIERLRRYCDSIDALDPGDAMDDLSADDLRAIVFRMGEHARAALTTPAVSTPPEDR